MISRPLFHLAVYLAVLLFRASGFGQTVYHEPQQLYRRRRLAETDDRSRWSVQSQGCIGCSTFLKSEKNDSGSRESRRIPQRSATRATSDTIPDATDSLPSESGHGRLHWSVANDVFYTDWEHNETDKKQFLSMIGFDIRGNPLPLKRHRSSRGFLYNPSAGAQESFRNTVRSIVHERVPKLNADDPWFASHYVLRMTLVFYLKRPMKHFIGNRPGPGRLRTAAPSSHSLTKKDIDNLAKFVMDSLNGFAYVDDHQIVSLHATKLLDDVDECLGRTRVRIEVLKDGDLDGMLQ